MIVEIHYRSASRGYWVPDNLKLNTFLQEFHSDCPHPECSFGFYGYVFGQSLFHVPELVQKALTENIHKGEYDAVPDVE